MQTPNENLKSEKTIQSLNWPSDSLEIVESCPVCNSASSSILIQDAYDNLFFCAPGRWNVYRCAECRSAYLNPRPNKETISKAYIKYYTHTESSPKNILQVVSQTLAIGYRNYRYGNDRSLSAIVGFVVASALPSRKSLADSRMRHIPPAPTEESFILDIGCGGGDFLARIRDTGWKAIGQDIDPKAIDLCRQRGLDVIHASLDNLAKDKNYHAKFEGITLSHVLEHVHNPYELLCQCLQLLKPGGWIWVETPNLDSKGFMKFGKCWIGIDAPRHLTHFTYDSLYAFISKAGFQRIEDMPYRPLCANYFSLSEQIRNGNGCYPRNSIINRFLSWIRYYPDEIVARYSRKKREFCTFRAYAPKQH